MKKLKAFTSFYPNQKFLERFAKLVEKHAFYTQQFNVAESSNLEIQVHIMRIEEELCFLLSLLQKDEYHELFKNGFKISWSIRTDSAKLQRDLIDPTK
ncbi:hypothetical protein COD86_29650 [Bacillus cereus]|nr:hypothetical protein COD14_31535 [Bacillus cereus]PGV87922.1 hypothetical protein COD86_29650 [Bacillus cereus]